MQSVFCQLIAFDPLRRATDCLTGLRGRRARAAQTRVAPSLLVTELRLQWTSIPSLRVSQLLAPNCTQSYTTSSAEARKLMSHEHRALGFRPPPGSLAAEAQAAAAKHADGLNGTNAKASNAKARRNSNEPSRKPRQNSMGANTGVRQRRGSSETRTKPRRESHGANGPANGGAKQTFRRGSNDMNGAGKQGARRGSNESQKSWRSSTEMKRTSSDQSTSTATPKAAVNGNAARRASAHVAPSTATKEELLREAALRDAERIKYVPPSSGCDLLADVCRRMTRGINGTSVTEHAHVDIKDLAEDDRKGESITLPGPAQANVDHDAKAQPSARDAATGKQGEVGIKEAMPGAAIKNEPPVTQGEVAPGELEHESGRAPVMPRTETTDSVQIICNILG